MYGERVRETDVEAVLSGLYGCKSRVQQRKRAQFVVSELSRYRREVNQVVNQRARREPDLTAALGWTLAQSPT